MEKLISNIAQIHYCEGSKLFTTKWLDCQNSEDFVKVILKVMDLYKIVLPRKVLWNHTNFDLELSQDLQLWTENTINIPSKALGCVEKISFVVSSDVMSQLSVMDIFDKSDTNFAPKYFTDKAECIDWLTKPASTENINVKAPSPLVRYDSIKNKFNLSIDVDEDEVYEYLFLFNKLIKTKHISLSLVQSFMTLTPQEKKITKMLIEGEKINAISSKLHISTHTTLTHKKNIYKKLNCKSIHDLLRFSYLCGR